MSRNQPLATQAQAEECNPTEAIALMTPLRVNQQRNQYLVSHETDTGLITNPCINIVTASEDCSSANWSFIAASDEVDSSGNRSGGLFSARSNIVNSATSFVIGSETINISDSARVGFIASDNTTVIASQVISSASSNTNAISGCLVVDLAASDNIFASNSVVISSIASNFCNFANAIASCYIANGGSGADPSLISGSGAILQLANISSDVIGSSRVVFAAGDNNEANAAQVCAMAATSYVRFNAVNLSFAAAVTGSPGAESQILGGSNSALLADAFCTNQNAYYSATLASEYSGVQNPGFVVCAGVVASRGVLNSKNYSLRGGWDAATTPTTAAATWEIDSQAGVITAENGIVTGVVADYAYYQENLIAGKEIPNGAPLVFEHSDDNQLGIKVRISEDGEYLDSAITAIAAIKLNDAPFSWAGKYVKDEFGSPLLDFVESSTLSDIQGVADRLSSVSQDVLANNKKGDTAVDFSNKKIDSDMVPTGLARRVNPQYKPDSEYVPRSQRPDEWSLCIHTGYVPICVDDSARPGSLLIGGTKGMARAMTPKEEASMPRRKKVFEVTRISMPFDKEKGYAVAMVHVH